MTDVQIYEYLVPQEFEKIAYNILLKYDYKMKVQKNKEKKKITAIKHIEHSIECLVIIYLEKKGRLFVKIKSNSERKRINLPSLVGQYTACGGLCGVAAIIAGIYVVYKSATAIKNKIQEKAAEKERQAREWERRRQEEQRREHELEMERLKIQKIAEEREWGRRRREEEKRIKEDEKRRRREDEERRRREDEERIGVEAKWDPDNYDDHDDHDDYDYDDVNDYEDEDYHDSEGYIDNRYEETTYIESENLFESTYEEPEKDFDFAIKKTDEEDIQSRIIRMYSVDKMKPRDISNTLEGISVREVRDILYKHNKL